MPCCHLAQGFARHNGSLPLAHRPNAAAHWIFVQTQAHDGAPLSRYNRRTVMAPLLLFRTEASAAIGLGHALRCLAVAEAAVTLGAKAALMLDDWPAGLADKARRCGVDVLTSAAPLGSTGDADALLALPDMPVLVLDGYRLEAPFLGRLHAARKLAFFDDLFALPHVPCAVIINSARHAPALPYSARTQAHILAGPAYAPLRPAFARWRAAHPLPLADSNHLLLTLGGADPLALSAPLAAALHEALPDVRLTLVVGSANPRADALRAVPGCEILVDPPDLADLFGASRLAVSAAGGTTAELATLGVPTLALIVADNQEDAAKSGVFPSLDARTTPPASIAREAARLWQDEPARQRLSELARAAVDGKGAERIARALLAL